MKFNRHPRAARRRRREETMPDSETPTEVLLERLEALANHSLHLWEEVPENATARLINVSENTTYLVEAPGWKSVLRVHRENYHTETAINCELDWSAALNRDGVVVTPRCYPGRDGKAVQTASVRGLPGPRHLVMFHFVSGDKPDENNNLTAPFEALGEMAARMHNHSVSWPRPESFERPTWDLETIFGPAPTWGDWRDAPHMTAGIKKTLQHAEDTITRRLSAFGKGAQRYGLIHADMRLANLLVGDAGTRLIDFDDCGMGWFLYDFAAGISFIEDHPQVPALKSAWVKGYRKARPLSEDEFDEIDTFVMLRRLALLAWIGSHIDAPEPQMLAADFARVSADLAAAYLDQFAG